MDTYYAHNEMQHHYVIQSHKSLQLGLAKVIHAVCRLDNALAAFSRIGGQSGYQTRQVECLQSLLQELFLVYKCIINNIWLIKSYAFLSRKFDWLWYYIYINNSLPQQQPPNPHLGLSSLLRQNNNSCGKPHLQKCGFLSLLNTNTNV